MQPAHPLIAAAFALAAFTAGCSADPTPPAAAVAPAAAAPAAAAPAALTENDKIERLLTLIGSMQGATFIRNGSDHTAKEAVDHLRMKWKSSLADITTAREFVDRIATKSSLTGEPYRIRLADGTVVEAGAYFGARLTEIEQPR